MRVVFARAAEHSKRAVAEESGKRSGCWRVSGRLGAGGVKGGGGQDVQRCVMTLAGAVVVAWELMPGEWL